MPFRANRAARQVGVVRGAAVARGYFAFSIAARLGAGWQQLFVPSGCDVRSGAGCFSTAREATATSALAAMRMRSRFTWLA